MSSAFGPLASLAGATEGTVSVGCAVAIGEGEGCDGPSLPIRPFKSIIADASSASETRRVAPSDSRRGGGSPETLTESLPAAPSHGHAVGGVHHQVCRRWPAACLRQLRSSLCFARRISSEAISRRGERWWLREALQRAAPAFSVGEPPLEVKSPAGQDPARACWRGCPLGSSTRRRRRRTPCLPFAFQRRVSRRSGRSVPPSAERAGARRRRLADRARQDGATQCRRA